jgi:hypothetical protein
MEKRTIYNDKRKMTAVVVSLVLVAVIVMALVLTRSSSIPLVVIGVLVAAVLLVAAASTVRKMVANPALFVFDEDGVTDLTKPDDVITLPWSQVIGVKLQASNNNDLLLDVYGYKTRDQLDVITPQMDAQLRQNEDRAYYCLELSGLWIRRGRIREAFLWLKDNVAKVNPAVEFADFDDPLSHLGEKKPKPGDNRQGAKGK